MSLEIDLKNGTAVQQSITQTEQALHRTTQAAQQTTQSFNQLGSMIRTAFSVAIGNIITQPLYAIMDAIGSIIPTAANFEQKMADIKAVLNPTGAEFTALSEKARQLGRDTAFSASESAAAMEMLAKNGLSATQILDGAADATVAFAAAAGTDLTKASDVATQAMLSFNLQASDMPNVVNEAVGVLNASKFDVNDYALALGQAGGIAGGLGISLTDFNAVIASTSSLFHSGSDAGTSFKTFLLDLIPKSKEAASMMQQLGIITADGKNQFFDATGAVRPFAEIIDLLREKIGGLSKEQQSDVLKTLFGADAARTAIGLMNQTGAAFDALKAKLVGTDAAAAAATRLDTFNGAVSTLKSSLEGVTLTLGDMFLPALTDIVQGATGAINTLNDIVQAVNGSQEAFNRLSPAAQMVVIAFQTIGEAISSAIAIIQSVVGDLAGNLESVFGSIANQAFGWGNNIGSMVGDGMLDSISEIVSAANAIGDALSYWLSPGSPPRIAPDLDVWGKEVGEVYYDAIASANPNALIAMGEAIYDGLMNPFDTADYGAIVEFTDNVEDILSGLADTKQITDEESIAGILGSSGAFTEALGQLKEFGSISLATLNNIIDSAGAGGYAIRDLTLTFVGLKAASYDLANAQKELTAAQEKLNGVNAEYDAATKEIRDSLEKLRKEQEMASLADQIKEQEKLANAVGGDGSVQAKAKQKLIELTLKQQLLEKEMEFEGRIKDAETEVTLAEKKVKDAEEAARVAQEAYDLELAKLEAQKQQNDLIAEQIKLMEKLAKQAESGGSGGGGSAAGTNKDKEAQEAYAYSIATTAEKMDILKARLAGVAVGSAEYYKILGQIGSVQKELDKEQEKEQAALDKKAKAQWDYNYSIADNAGKMKMLKEQLASTAEGSVEYYKILGQIKDLQKDIDKPASGGGGSRIPSGGASDPGGDQGPTPAETIKKTFEDAKLAAEQAKETVLRFQESARTARDAFMSFIEPIQPIIDVIKNNFVPILAGLAVPAVLAIAGAIGGVLTGALAALLSPIVAAMVAVGLLVAAWQNNFADIQGFTASVVESLSSIIATGLAVITGFWNEHGTEVMAFVSTTWNTIVTTVTNLVSAVFNVISSVLATVAAFIAEHQTTIQNIFTALWFAIRDLITNVLGIITGIVNAFIALTQGDWSAFGTALLTIATTFMNLVSEAIRGVFVIILSIFGVSATDAQKIWDGLGILLTKATQTFMDDVNKIVTVAFLALDKAYGAIVTTVTTTWDKFKTILPDGVTAAINAAIKAVTDLQESFAKSAEGVGKSFVDGIVDGIKSKVQSVIDAAKALVRDAISAANSAQDSHSPSRVMMEAGANFTAGFVQGIQDTIGNASLSINSAMGTLTNIPLPSMGMSEGGTKSVVNNLTFNIDARGSDMSEAQFRDIIRTEVDGIARTGNIRGRI